MPASKVLLFSGGLDSTTLLWDLRPDVKCLLFHYGQRHVRELENAVALCQRVEVEFEIVNLTAIHSLIAKGSQAGPDPVPLGHYADESMKLTVVPNRNMIMLSVAIGHAVAIGAKGVYTAVHAGDHAIYPDCRPDFIYAMNRAAQIGNEWTPVEVFAPYVNLTKAEIVQHGHYLGVPYRYTWSCYQGLDLHCKRCGTCVERQEAFALAGVPDPTKYEEDKSEASSAS